MTEEGFSVMASLLLDVAGRHAGGKIAFLLEGGYHLPALRNSVASVLHRMEEGRDTGPLSCTAGERIDPIVRSVLSVHEKCS